MKIFAMICAALCCMMAMPLNAAISNAKTYEAAKKKANARRPVVLFCYGANYDRVSERTYEEFIKKRRLQRALGAESAILVCVPIYQLPNDKEKKTYNGIMAGGKLPGGIWSYPCLALVDSKGNLRGVVQSAEEMRTPEAAAKALTVLLKDFRSQEALLAKADKASGGRKLRLLCDAAGFKTFMPRALEGLDNNKLIQELDVMKPAEANAHIRRLMATHCYSKRQRQEILAAYAGHLRRKGASANLLRAVYTEMRNIDPESIYARYAEGAIELWVVPNEPASKRPPVAADKPSGSSDAAGDKGKGSSKGKSSSSKDSASKDTPKTDSKTPEPAPEPAPAEEDDEDDDDEDDGDFSSGDDSGDDGEDE